MFQFVSISKDDIDCAMLSIDIIHMLHAHTNSHLLLVWKRSKTKGAYFRKLERAVLYNLFNIYDIENFLDIKLLVLLQIFHPSILGIKFSVYEKLP